MCQASRRPGTSEREKKPLHDGTAPVEVETAEEMTPPCFLHQSGVMMVMTEVMRN